MYINDETIKVYLEEGDVDRFNDCWYFSTSSIAREQEGGVRKLYQLFLEGYRGFANIQV